MFVGKLSGYSLNNKINDIHEIALRVVYQDNKSSLKTLSKHDKSTSIRMKILQYFATELLMAFLRKSWN